MFYSIYDNGAKAAMGNFASFEAIPGSEVRTVFFDPVNSLVSGDMTSRSGLTELFRQVTRCGQI